MVRPRQFGFTLIEVLASMSLLVVFGYLVFSLMRNSLEVWRKGEWSASAQERASSVLDLLGTDLQSLHSGRSARFFSELNWEKFRWQDRESEEPIRTMRFLRDLGIAEEERLLRRASLEGAARSGLARIDYESRRDPLGSDPALQVLYRSALPYDPNADFDRSTELKFQEVIGGVLYWGVSFAHSSDAEFPSVEESQSWPALGFEHVWDSTRGGSARDAAHPAKKFSLALGETSRLDFRDDVFPERIRCVLVVEEELQSQQLASLRKDLSPEDFQIEFSDLRKMPHKTPAYVKIGVEWFLLGSIQGNTASIQRRGARGTAASFHVQGSKIHFGQEYVREIPLSRNGKILNVER